MLALVGDWEHFASSVEWIGKNLQFDIVSLFLSLSLMKIDVSNLPVGISSLYILHFWLELLWLLSQSTYPLVNIN